MNSNQTEMPFGVFQYFYHCMSEYLPIRDVCDTQGHGEKTEPHYENLTENWCSKCMNRRIRSANRLGLKHVFLITRYSNKRHKFDGKLLVVGFLYRAEDKVWRKWSRSIPSKVAKYDSNKPKDCGFFVGDEKKSRFVSADDAYVLKGVSNGRWKYFATPSEGEEIVSHLKKSKNILPSLRKRVAELKSQEKHSNHELQKNKKRQEACCGG